MSFAYSFPTTGPRQGTLALMFLINQHLTVAVPKAARTIRDDLQTTHGADYSLYQVRYALQRLDTMGLVTKQMIGGVAPFIMWCKS